MGTPLDALEAKIRERITRLEIDFASKRDNIVYMLQGVSDDDLGRCAPYRIYGIDTSELDNITIQIGTLTLVLMQIYEVRASSETRRKRSSG